MVDSFPGAENFDSRGFAKHLAKLVVEEVRHLIASEQNKEWYSTEELAEALGKSIYTIREHWCNSGRIECEKDDATGKWRIPGNEYRRLIGGGSLN